MNNNLKFNTLYSAPVLNSSGYGVASDLIWYGLSTYPKINLLTAPLIWGGNAPKYHRGKWDQAIRDNFPKTNQIPPPHLFISHTLPHMSKPSGSIHNISINAGVEVVEVPTQIAEAFDRFDTCLVCSNHTKQGYLNSKFKMTKEIQVLPWSTDTDIYRPDAPEDASINETMAKIKETEAFLFVGQAGGGGPDRKDLEGLVTTFCNTFKGKAKQPALILKIHGINYSKHDRNACIEIVEAIKATVPDNDTPVYVFHGELTESQMAALYTHPKIIGNASFTHGEGFGLPLLEASCTGKPILVSNWSGHLDFLDKDHTILLPGEVKPVESRHITEYVPPNSQWFFVDYAQASKIMLDFYNSDRTEANQKALELAEINRHKYSLDMFKKRLHGILDKALL